MFSIIAGLGAALCYGISDFAGGRASHRIAVVQVLVIGEVVGAFILWGIAYALGEPLLATTNIAVAIAAGLCGAIGVAALYLGIAAGHTAITVPVSAVLATIVPVLYGIGAQGIPSVTVMAGIGLGIAAITLNSFAGPRTGNRGVWEGLIAGVAFGVYFILLTHISTGDAVYAPLALSRSSALLVTIPWLIARPGGRPTWAGFGLAVVACLFDIGAAVMFFLAARYGRLDVASVLASLYPAVTVLLAATLLREHIRVVQRWGLALTLAATLLIAL
jgi:drug/metabolite transporter (DMT)-like permease